VCKDPDIKNGMQQTLVFNLCSLAVGRPRRRWEDNIKMDFQVVGGGCGDWMELAEDRDKWQALVSMVMNLRVPKMRGIF